MSGRAEPRTSCPSCARGELHCHGTLVLHADETWECTEDGCVLEAEQHALVIECAEVVPACRCAQS